MDCPTFEIEVDTPGEDKLLSIWGEQQILQRVGWLKARNNEGARIGIRPASKTQNALIFLELEQSKLERMQKDGFNPSVVVRISPQRRDAWIRLGSRPMPPVMRNIATQILAKRYDLDVTAWSNSFGRLAGFNTFQHSMSQRMIFDCQLETTRNHQIQQAAWLWLEAEQELLNMALAIRTKDTRQPKKINLC